jgi:hypothetical protein
VHYLNTQADDTLQVRETLQQRRGRGCISAPLKHLVLQHLKESGSLDYTKDGLQRFERQITGDIERLENLTGRKNWVLRLCMQKLCV